MVKVLQGRGAHVPFERAVADVPEDRRGIVPEGAATSLWQQLEHLRIAQWDILEFSRDPAHVRRSSRTVTGRPGRRRRKAAGRASVDRFLADRAAMAELVSDPQSDLYTPFAHGAGQTLLREALVVADHNSYHVGQMVLLRRLLGCW